MEVSGTARRAAAASHAGRTVVQNDVRLPILNFVHDRLPAFLRGDVFGKADHVFERLDRHEVDAENDAVHGHVLGTYLRP